MSTTRTETDSFGPIEVPADAYWGAQTERSIENFPFGPREQMPLEIVHAIGFIKQAAARVNARIGGLDPQIAEAIQQAAAEVARGDLDSQFPLVIWQTGSGTQSNMNANEVIAGRANEKLSGTRGGKDPVHPNDDVNKGQSSNDSFPTALHVSAALAVNGRLLPALKLMHERLADLAKRWEGIVKIGRTHLQDATPLTLGQEFSGYAQQIADNIDRVEGVMPRVYRLAQGGTAVGTGLNAPQGFGDAFAKEIANLTRLPFTSAPNKFAELAAHDTMVELSGVLNTIAVSLTKIAQDIALMGSGPRAGIGEIFLPELQKGSSIMPGKVNPVIPEVVIQVGDQVIGNDAAIAIAGTQGQFELNVRVPLIARNLLDSIKLLAAASRALDEKCVRGIEANKEMLTKHAESTLATATALNPHIGYDKAAEIVKEAAASGKTAREVAREKGVDEKILDEALDHRKLAKPHE